MKLIEALRIVNTSSESTLPRKRLFLATGFTPLHLVTFVHAHAQRALPDSAVTIDTGIFGDLAGNIARVAESGADAAAVVIEWSDLDGRLGLRTSGGWSVRSHDDILRTAELSLARIEQEVRKAAAACPVALAGPTLPFPPVSYTPSWQAGELELSLNKLVSEFFLSVSAIPRVTVLSATALAAFSPPGQRFDVQSELAYGFPYTQTHADALGGLFAPALARRTPKKAIITDLDDTLWNGILGEVGVDGVHWDLASHSQVHALYQQMLGAFAEAGVLVGVASKNDPTLAAQALGREDLLIRQDQLYPVEAGWGVKSAAVSRILHKWNIGADSVVFVDDSPMELEEVKLQHPGIECVLFPKNKPQELYPVFSRLQDLFGKPQVSEEDRLRASSLRNSEALRLHSTAEEASPDVVLEQLGAVLDLQFSRDWNDARALELVNKTNQFNLNGNRFTPAEWQASLADPNAFLLVVSYRDKFGPLGKIAVLAGTHTDDVVAVHTWVMSCRAFSRRIEHQCLKQLFARFGGASIELAFQATDRNGPVQEFLRQIAVPLSSPARVSSAQFDERLPRLYHEVRFTDALREEREAALGS